MKKPPSMTEFFFQEKGWYGTQKKRNLKPISKMPTCLSAKVHSKKVICKKHEN